MKFDVRKIPGNIKKDLPQVSEYLGIPLFKQYFAKLQNISQSSGKKAALKDLLRTFQRHSSGEPLAKQEALTASAVNEFKAADRALLQNQLAFDNGYKRWVELIQSKNSRELYPEIRKLELDNIELSDATQGLKDKANLTEEAAEKAKTLLTDLKHKHDVVRRTSIAGGITAGTGAYLTGRKLLEKDAGWVEESMGRLKSKLKSKVTNLYNSTKPAPQKTTIKPAAQAKSAALPAVKANDISSKTKAGFKSYSSPETSGQ